LMHSKQALRATQAQPRTRSCLQSNVMAEAVVVNGRSRSDEAQG
jgi:hypothetical protein